jgi:hypothetical protein
LSLAENQIGVAGAKHVAAALKMNQVRVPGLAIYRYPTLTMSTDTHSTESWTEPDR